MQCLDGSHWRLILCVGIPGALLRVFLVPGLIAKTLVTQRGRGTLYPSQANYDSRWTMRMGFVFAGYKLGYEWWEADLENSFISRT